MSTDPSRLQSQLKSMPAFLIQQIHKDFWPKNSVRLWYSVSKSQKRKPKACKIMPSTLFLDIIDKELISITVGRKEFCNRGSWIAHLHGRAARDQLPTDKFWQRNQSYDAHLIERREQSCSEGSLHDALHDLRPAGANDQQILYSLPIYKFPTILIG